MGLLWLVTLGWAFSFSLIAEYLSGQVDDFIAVFLRVALAFLLFAPLLLRRRVPVREMLALMAIGALQIGLMYLFYFHAYNHLTVPELLLFTIFTPLYVTLIDELLLGQRRLPGRFWLAAVVAVLGAAVIRLGATSGQFVLGFVLIQCANLCFAAGQVFYKRLRLGQQLAQMQAFGYFFLGALLVTGPALLLFARDGAWPQTSMQWGVLVWLGMGASGLGYLAWNLGARRVNTGQLAVMNNMLIPAGILVNVLLWNRVTDWPRLSLGALLIVLAVWLARDSAGNSVRPGAAL